MTKIVWLNMFLIKISEMSACKGREITISGGWEVVYIRVVNFEFYFIFLIFLLFYLSFSFIFFILDLVEEVWYDVICDGHICHCHISHNHITQRKLEKILK